MQPGPSMRASSRVSPPSILQQSRLPPLVSQLEIRLLRPSLSLDSSSNIFAPFTSHLPLAPFV